MLDQSVIDFALYEDSNEYLGLAQVTMPDLTSILQTITGAGIAGNVEAPIIGHYEAMTMSINFRTTTSHSVRLCEPRRHIIDVRAAVQNENPVSNAIEVSREKHVMVIMPKSTKGGTIAPSAPSNGSGDYAVRYWATYLDGTLVREIDPLNNKCMIDGVDYLADVRSALGK